MSNLVEESSEECKMNLRNILHSGEVVRFHAHTGMEKQKNSEHQWGVAMILQHIYPECSKTCLLAALTHDAHEYFTGDIPAPTKWKNPALASILSEMESQWEEENGIKFDLHPDECMAIKLADTLDGMWTCILQVRCGRIDAKRPFRGWREFIIAYIASQTETTNGFVKNILSSAMKLSNEFIREMEKL